MLEAAELSINGYASQRHDVQREVQAKINDRMLVK